MSVFNRIMNKIFLPSHTDIGGQSRQAAGIKSSPPPARSQGLDVDGILTEAGLQDPDPSKLEDLKH
jgi:hypothetical protein